MCCSEAHTHIYRPIYVGDKHRQPIFFLSRLILPLPASSSSFRLESFYSWNPPRPLHRYGIIIIVRSVWANVNWFVLSPSNTLLHLNCHQRTVYSTCSLRVPTVCYYCTYSSTPLTQCCVTNRQTHSPLLCSCWQLFDFSISHAAVVKLMSKKIHPVPQGFTGEAF